MKYSIVLIAALLSGSVAYAQNEVECAFTSIDADITSNTTLSASTLYRIEGCVKVKSGYTLTIPAGTKLMGEKASTGTLIIEQGASLIANGTAMAPIIFTSDQKPGFRQAGDWGGLVLLGDAPVNVGTTLTLRGGSCPIIGGGSSPTDNSGSLAYLRIEYPVYGLTMVGVGSATTLNHIQVSEASQTSYDIHGGGADFKHFISLNAHRNDILANAGNVSKGQFILGLRLDNNAYVSDEEQSNGIVFANNFDTLNNFATAIGKPDNKPIYSNVSLIGPGYCHDPFNANFLNGVLYMHNTKGGIFNSKIANWRTGLRLEGQPVLDNADNGADFYFAENTFFGNNTDYSDLGSWPGNCATSLLNWITGISLSIDCEQLGNQFDATGIGLDNSFCGNLCITRPTLTLNPFQTGYNMLPPSYSTDALNNVFFEESDFRGAFDASTDWTADWANFCPQDADYCPPILMNGKVQNLHNNYTSMSLHPNPAQSAFNIQFTSVDEANARVRVLDYLGREVYNREHAISKGQNNINIPSQNWAKGVYFVTLDANGKAQTAKLVIE